MVAPDGFAQTILANGWRTGSVLTPAILQPILASQPRHIQARITACLQGNARAIVATQDCDLITASLVDEPFAECIIGDIVPACDATFQKLDSFRRIDVLANDNTALQLLSRDRFFFERRHLEASPATALHSLQPVFAKLLSRWYARKYGRAAFPNALNARLGANDKKSSLLKLLKSLRNDIHRIYLRCTPAGELEANSRYTLSIAIVLHSNAPIQPQTQHHLSELEAEFRSIAGIQIAQYRQLTLASGSFEDIAGHEEWHLERLTTIAQDDTDGAGRL